MKVLDIYSLKNWGLEIVIEVPKNNSCHSVLVVADKDDKKAEPLEIPIDRIEMLGRATQSNPDIYMRANPDVYMRVGVIVKKNEVSSQIKIKDNVNIK